MLDQQHANVHSAQKKIQHHIQHTELINPLISLPYRIPIKYKKNVHSLHSFSIETLCLLC